MKTYTQLKRWAFTALVLPGSIAFAQTKPAVTILPDTFVSVVIGDVQGLLDNIGALASKVMPGMDASMIKQQAGMMLGDPKLEGLPAGSGIAVVIPKDGMPSAYIEVAEGKAEQYQALLKQRNMGQGAMADGLLVVAMNEAALDGAKAVAGQVKSTMLAGSGSPSLTASVKLSEVLKKYDDQIQAGMKGMAEKVKAAESATTSTATVSPEALVGIFRGYYALAKRIDTLEIGIAPTAEGMTVTNVVAPVTKSEPSADPGSPEQAAKLMKALPGTGAMRGYAAIDFQSMIKLMGDVAKEIGSEGSTINAQALTDWFKQSEGVFGGAMAMNFMSDMESPFAGSFILSVKNEEATVKLLREMPAKLEEIGFNKLYESMGMPVSLKFEEKVGTYKEIPLHRLSMKIDFERGTDEQKARMKELMGSLVYDIAIADKTLIYAVKPQKVEDLIDAVKAGSNPATKPLVSETSLPPGARGYFDYNIGAAMLIAFKMSPPPGGAGAEIINKMAATVKDAPPVQVSWYNEDSTTRFITRFPAGMIKAFVEAGQQASSSAKASMKKDDGESIPEARKDSSGSKPTRTAGPRPKTTNQR